jgi:hypothetical protein
MEKLVTGISVSRSEVLKIWGPRGGYWSSGGREFFYEEHIYFERNMGLLIW